MTRLAERPQDAVARRRALLEALLSGDGGEASVPRTIPRRRGDGPAPLSCAQQRLWFFDQLMPGTPAYNLTLAKRIDGPLDVSLLERSLERVVERHDILRTTLQIIDGQPRQVVAAAAHVPFSYSDLRSRPLEGREREAARRASEEALRPFDLARDTPLRCVVMQLEDDLFHLLFVAHHSAFDVMSFGILFRELTTCYQAYAGDTAIQLPDLPIQYADYAEWQRDQVQSTAMQEQLDYWTRRLAAAPPVLELPLDKPRPSRQSFAGATYAFTIPADLVARVHDLSRRESVTPFMILLAAFQILLARYTGQDDIVVGSPIAERTLPETEDLIGFFINTLALRTHVEGELSCTDLLRRVRETTLEAFEHSAVPFDKVVEELRVERLKDRPPVFQVLFVLQNILRGEIELGDLHVSPLAVDDAVAAFDLTLCLWGTGGTLQAEVTYAADLFHHETIARFAGHYLTLLAAIVADPARRVDDLPLLTAPERTQLLQSWNATSAPYHRHLCLHQLIEAQAAETPDAPAVICGDVVLTYRELNTRANSVAHRLRAHGVGPDVLVGLCVERSAEMIVALLGILKAGGAYVPLDPAYPPQRLTHILDEARVALLLTQRHLCARLGAQTAPVLALDDIAYDAQADQNPHSGVTPQNLIYVIYTSGSTGAPRGSMVCHGAVVNHASAMVSLLQLGPSDRFLQFASLSFDASAVQIFPTLLSGAALVIHPAPAQLSHRDMLALCAAQGVTVLDVPTAYWHQMVVDLAAMPARPPARPRFYMTGGEAPSPEVLRLWSTIAGPQAVFLSSYGPTEATITATVYTTPNDASAIEALSVVPIGRPIANVDIYVLDAALQPVPIGVPGELYIGGAGVSRGYLGRPALTAERFIPHPLSAQPGERLYRTGDRARYWADGTLEFMGRLDHQVKVRGFRIELSEVQMAVARHPTVRECAVIVREDEPGDRRLVAYVVPQSPQEFSGAALRASLREQLPDHMVPSAIVVLESLPLTVNGKLDRRALPVPSGRSAADSVYVAPRSDIEDILAQLWCAVLRLERVGVHDDFFELGGHSLLATQLLSRICRAFQMELPLRVLFDSPTVAGLAGALLQHEPSAGHVVAVARLRKKIETMSPEQRRALLDAKQRQS